MAETPRAMKAVAFAITVMCAIVTAAVVVLMTPSAAMAQIRTVDLTVQGRARQYLLHVPSSPNGALVLVFHGGGQLAAQIQQASGFDAIADREHVIVAYPQAFARSWAAGGGTTEADRQGVDDVAFARAVVTDIAGSYSVDRRRVFAIGMSNGAILTHRLACQAADTFAAIAPVAGALFGSIGSSCRPSAPVAIIGINGTADPSVHFNGGFAGDRAAGEPLESVRATQERWRSLNGCAPAVATTTLPVVERDGTSVSRRSYGGCRADVVWYEIEGGGHRWPPAAGDDPRGIGREAENGVATQNLQASEVIWAFFASHPRRTPPSSRSSSATVEHADR